MSNFEYPSSILLEGLDEEMYFNMENSFFSWHSFLDSPYATFSSSDSLESSEFSLLFTFSCLDSKSLILWIK